MAKGFGVSPITNTIYYGTQDPVKHIWTGKKEDVTDGAIGQLNELGLGLGQKVETLDLHPTEAVVVYFNFNDIHLDKLNAFYEMLQDKFPNNTIAACPDKISLQSWSKDMLEDYMSMIQDIIDEL